MAIDYENKIYDKVIASPYLEEFETSLNQITCLPVRNIFYENLEISTLDIPLLRPLNYISFLNIWYEKIPVISLEETSEEMIANIQKSFQIANQLNLLKNQKQVLYYDYLLSKQAQYNRKYERLRYRNIFLLKELEEQMLKRNFRPYNPAEIEAQYQTQLQFYRNEIDPMMIEDINANFLMDFRAEVINLEEDITNKVEFSWSLRLTYLISFFLVLSEEDQLNVLEDLEKTIMTAEDPKIIQTYTSLADAIDRCQEEIKAEQNRKKRQ